MLCISIQITIELKREIKDNRIFKFYDDRKIPFSAEAMWAEIETCISNHMSECLRRSFY